jgi:spore germination cell wall hydrolase CwlJ-like protein
MPWTSAEQWTRGAWTIADQWLVAQTIYGEARGEPWEGQLAVGYVIRNRQQKSGLSVAQVVMARGQFTCWLLQRQMLRRLTFHTPRMLDCLAVALLVDEGRIPDPSRGSCYFCTRTSRPAWIRGHTPVVTIGQHRFFNTIPYP